MGAAPIAGLVSSILSENKLEHDDAALQQTRERINQLSELIDLKLSQFYDKIVLQSNGKDAATANVPICSVVRREQSMYVVLKISLTTY